MKTELLVLPKSMAICRLAAGDSFPAWALLSLTLLSLTRTEEELSIVCEESLVPPEFKAVRSWRALKVKGPLDFSLTGILAAIADPLAKAGISIFTIATYDTDYLLVRAEDLERAKSCLTASGFGISE